jgi:hypothetical protein
MEAGWSLCSVLSGLAPIARAVIGGSNAAGEWTNPLLGGVLDDYISIEALRSQCSVVITAN